MDQDKKDGLRILKYIVAISLLGYFSYFTIRQGIPQWLLNTILTGSITFIAGLVGFYFAKHVSEPVTEYEKIKREVISKLIYYERVYYSFDQVKPEVLTESGNSLRKLAADLSASYQVINWKTLARTIFFITSESNIREAVNKLIRLSNVTNVSDTPMEKTRYRLNIVTYVLDIERLLNVEIDSKLLKEKEDLELDIANHENRIRESEENLRRTIDFLSKKNDEKK